MASALSRPDALSAVRKVSRGNALVEHLLFASSYLPRYGDCAEAYTRAGLFVPRSIF